MFNFFIKLVLLSILSISLQAQSGLTQKHLVSVTPEALATGVSVDTIIEVVFDRPIVASSVKKNTIKLKNVKGITTLVGDSTLLFTPNEVLKSGTHKVKVKKIKLQNRDSSNAEHKPTNGYERFIHWLCSLFYDDLNDCPLYKYLHGDTTIKTQKIKYSFSVNETKPKIISLTLNKSNIELNENNQTTIHVNAMYDNNLTQDVTNNVEWIMSNDLVISISKNTITPLSEGVTSLQAKLNNITSALASVLVYKEINGYKLPPEPDPAVNNSTMLGIDSNDNGVRDDVEIYVIKRFAQDPDFPKTKTAIAMQYAWSTQKILESPTIDSKKYSDDAIDCQYYWFDKKQKDINQNIINLSKTDFKASIQESLNAGKWRKENKVFNDSKIKDKIYNTRVRIEQKFSYNAALSGNIFNGREESLQNCQINIDKLGE